VALGSVGTIVVEDAGIKVAASGLGCSEAHATSIAHKGKAIRYAFMSLALIILYIVRLTILHPNIHEKIIEQINSLYLHYLSHQGLNSFQDTLITLVKALATRRLIKDST
jgi:hypothetical protein